MEPTGVTVAQRAWSAVLRQINRSRSNPVERAYGIVWTICMPPPESSSTRAKLRSALTDAMKQRDREAVAVYRSALAAIDNAEAVPGTSADGAVELSPAGVGHTDVPRSVLSEGDVIEIVQKEVEALRVAADSIAAAKPDVAARLRREAALLLGLVGGADVEAERP